MKDTILTLVFLIPIIVGFAIFRFQQKKHVSFTKRVLTALGLAIVYGGIINVLLSMEVIQSTGDLSKWLVLFGYGYVDLLRMISIPLIFISLIASINNLQKDGQLGKKAVMVILVLVITAGLSAAIGYTTASVFNLNANDVLGVDYNEVNCSEVLENGHSNELVIDACKYGTARAGKVENGFKDLPSTLRSFIPKQPLYALTGADSNSTIKVVVYAIFLGVALLGVKRKYPEDGEFLSKLVNSTQKLIMRLTTIVLRLTPYGIFALLTRVVAFTGTASIIALGKFLAANYIALTLVFIMHAIILWSFGFNAFKFFKKGFTALSFAFISRSSAGTLPITLDTQKTRFGVSEGISALSSSFGTSIGQNGCAGVYPAMIVAMIWGATGHVPSIIDVVTLIVVVVISSFGIAGIGGGATFAAIAVVSGMNLGEFLWLTGVLYSIEALIDMYRTSVNVSGSMVAGLVTSKLTKDVDMEVYNKKLIDLEPIDSLEL